MKKILSVLAVLATVAPALADPHETGIRRKDYDRHENRDVQAQGRSAIANDTADGARAEYLPAPRGRDAGIR
jgi:hypothetical protein